MASCASLDPMLSAVCQVDLSFIGGLRPLSGGLFTFTSCRECIAEILLPLNVM